MSRFRAPSPEPLDEAGAYHIPEPDLFGEPGVYLVRPDGTIHMAALNSMSAAYHNFGQWHARGGSQSLTDALVTRLHSHGGQLRCAAPVEAFETADGRVAGVRLAGGERFLAGTVTAAIDPKTALLQLLRPP